MTDKTRIAMLREAAKKYVSTLDAHRKSPRDALAVSEWDDATGTMDVLINNDEINLIVALFGQLEVAEARIKELEANLVPVAWTDAQELRDMAKDGCGYLFKVDPSNPFTDPRRQIMLFTKPPKP